MRIGGLQKLTLLDYPGRVACTVFLSGCNFRCPFCHNTPLVIGTGENISEETFFRFLDTRQGLLDGVAVTGGEPLLQPALEPFLRHIRERGFAVKLDTNGAFPARLEALMEAGLVDYVAMDIKNCPEKYEITAGVPVNLQDIRHSASLLMQGSTDYEFRTTVVDELHEPADFEVISAWLSGAKRYFLQEFVDSGDIFCQGMHAAGYEKMEQCLAIARKGIPAAQLRGE